MSLLVSSGTGGQVIKVYAIDAAQIAREVGLAGRINIVLQTCFFAACVCYRNQVDACPAIPRFGQTLVVIRREVLFHLPDRLLDHIEVIHQPFGGL